MKKKLKLAVARIAARTPGPLSQIQADRKTARVRISATVESARPGTSRRIAVVAATRAALPRYPGQRAFPDVTRPF